MTTELRVVRQNARDLYELRRRVLRGNDPRSTVAHPRDDEESTLHLGGVLDGRVVVAASFYRSRRSDDGAPVTYQLRYMAADSDVRGRGYGTLVLAEAERVLLDAGARVVWANARDSALGFYRATGWLVLEGSEHLSVETNLPHSVIVKWLEDGARSRSTSG